MLSEISWGSYLAGAGTILLLYYAGVALTCYRKEIGELIRKGRKTGGGDTAAIAPTADASFEALEATTEEINSVLHKAGQKASKPELLRQLRPVLANYAGLRQPAFKAAVFNHIIKQAEEVCGVRISEEELEA